METLQIAQTILNQLGGHKFVVMTGAKNIYADNISKYPGLVMKIGRNSAGINNVKISLLPDDTYKMEFCKKSLTKDFDVKITNYREFTGVYCDQLQEIFTDVTGMYTYL